MKKLFILSVFVLAGCSQTGLYSPEQQARVMSDAYLCKEATGRIAEDIQKAEIGRREIDCKKVIENKEKAKAAASKKEKKAQEERYADANRLHRQKPKIRNISDQVLADSIDQYYIVSDNGGSHTERCVYAGMVKAAAAQAKRQDYYRAWNDFAKLDCSLAEWLD